ncbi:MAG: hypothetical protein SGCHY_003360 [Lobulomycetales sp.]
MTEVVSGGESADDDSDHLDDLEADEPLAAHSALPEDLARYETFRRTKLSRPAIKKIVSSTLGITVNPQSILLISGVAKVLVSELVELSFEVQRDWNVPAGVAISPDILREAWMRYNRRKRRNTSSVALPKRLFR